jgi:hypothetical protein
MTHEQQRALAIAYLTLEAAFDHGVIIVSDKEEQKNVELVDPEVCWFGGRYVAQCLSENAMDKIKFRRKLTRSPPRIDPDVMKKIDKWIHHNLHTGRP